MEMVPEHPESSTNVETKLTEKITRESNVRDMIPLPVNASLGEALVNSH